MSDGAKKPVYGPDDLGRFDVARQLGQPGQFPFTRGIHPTGYPGRLWTMRQFAGFGAAEDPNERYKFLPDHGQTALPVRFAFPPLRGSASDPRAARGGGAT